MSDEYDEYDDEDENWCYGCDHSFWNCECDEFDLWDELTYEEDYGEEDFGGRYDDYDDEFCPGTSW